MAADLMHLYLSHRQDVRWRDLGRRVIVLHQPSGSYYTLNELGGFLWKSLDGRRRLCEVLKGVMERYAIDEDTARADILEVAGDLISEGLVEIITVNDET